MGGWQLFLYIVISLVINYALAPKQKPQAPEAFKEIDFPQVEDGTPIPVIFGDVWTEDWTVLAVGDYRTTEMRKDAGGK